MLGSYLKLAWKVFLRRRVFTAISLFGIAFTLLVLVVAAAVADHVVGPMAPETHQDRTLCVYSVHLSGDDNSWTSEGGYGLFDKYLRGLPGVEEMSIFSTAADVTSYHGGGRIESSLKRTDGAFWRILEFTFVEGGPFTDDDVANARPLAVVNETTRRRFFGDGPALGQALTAGGQNFQVVGVVRDVPPLRLAPFADIWAPVTTAKSDGYRREIMGGFMALYLARSPSDFPALRDEFQARLRAVPLPDPRRWKTIESQPATIMEFVATTVLGHRPAQTSPPTGASAAGSPRVALLWALLSGLVLLFMLLPTLNLVNLSVSRILERAPEIGVRKAFGASSRALVGQFVVENVALTLVGGLLALLAAPLVLHVLNQAALVPYAHFTVNHRVFACGLGLAVVFGVLSGAYPAWRMARLHPVAALKGGGR